MSQFYQRLADTALRLIDNKGVDCTIVTKGTSGGFDPVTGLPLPPTPSATQIAKCVVLNYSKAVTSMPNSLILQGDKKILIAAKGAAMPQIGAVINTPDKAYTVVAVTDNKPADVALVYEVHGRE